MDKWIIGDSPDSGRTYVVHAVSPRFILEIIDLDSGQWKAGALVWLDDPGSEDAGRWTQGAGDMFYRWIQVAHDVV